ncbi:MAG TPA: IS66 family transposase [Steroidobacteraceae bacterium]|nr:IS66 family transposase [Steroidobacteraceae bacterium]
MPSTAAALPDDVQTLKDIILAQREQMAAQERRIEHLLEQFRLARHRQFGASSEKAPGQGEFFNEAEYLSGAVTEEEPAAAGSDASSSAPRTRGARKPLPPELPRVQIRHVLPEDQRRCACGCELTVIGHEDSEQLDVIPARIQVLHHIRERYACSGCEAAPVLAPLPAQPIPKSNASSGLLAHIAVAKYQDGLPLHRQEHILARSGIDLPRQTLARWMIRVAQLAQPVLNLFWDELLSNAVIHCDETVVQVLKELDKPPTSNSYMWALAAGPADRSVVLFDYHPSRSGEVPKRLLADFHGYVMTDGYEGYNSLSGEDGVKHLCCMVHARRRFRDAQRAQPSGTTGRADIAMEYFRKLYQIERRIANADVHTRYQTRQNESVPLLKKFRAWLDEALTHVAPKGVLGEALQYLDKYWPKLIRYCEDGRLPIDNNRLENAIRPFVIGRKAWLFCDTPAGAHASAALYSLIETAKAAGIEPYSYLRHLFTALPHATALEHFEALLPWNLDRSLVASIDRPRAAD